MIPGLSAPVGVNEDFDLPFVNDDKVLLIVNVTRRSGGAIPVISGNIVYQATVKSTLSQAFKFTIASVGQQSTASSNSYTFIRNAIGGKFTLDDDLELFDVTLEQVYKLP